MATVTNTVRRPATAAWLSVLAALSFLSVALSVVLIFLYAPRDVDQGEVQRLFYLHLPAAWLAYLSFSSSSSAASCTWYGACPLGSAGSLCG